MQQQANQKTDQCDLLNESSQILDQMMKGRRPCASSASDTVVRALRNEINASFDAHKCVVQSIAKEFSSLRQPAPLRQRASSQRSFASQPAQWQAFDQLMESVVISSMPSRSPSQPQQQSKQKKTEASIRLAQSLLERKAVDRAVDLHQMLLLWRQVARVRGERKRMQVLVQGRHSRTALHRVLVHWFLWSSTRRRRNDAATKVRQTSSAALLSTAYMRWRSALSVQRLVFGLQGRRAFECQRQAFSCWLGTARRQKRVRRFLLYCQGQRMRGIFKLWRGLALSQRGKRVRLDCARAFQLRSLWHRWTQYHQQSIRSRDLMSAISHQRDRLVAEESFDRWCSYVEAKKRSRFARAWRKQHILAEIVDTWRSAQLWKRRERRIVESALRRRQRRWLALCMSSWRHAVEQSRHRKRSLMQCLSRRDLSRGFASLHRYWRWISMLERNRVERMAQSMIWNWYLHTQHRKRIRIAAERVSRQSSVRVLRTIAWVPWREALAQSIKHRCILNRYRKKTTMNAWLALVRGLAECAHRQAQLRSVDLALTIMHQRQAVKRWSEFSSCMKQQRTLEQDSHTFRSRGLGQLGIQRWSAWMQHRKTRCALVESSAQHFLRRFLRRWILNAASRKSARTQIGFQIATRYRARSLIESLVQWKTAVYKTKRMRSRWVFQSWKRFVFEQHRESTLAKLSCNLWERRVWKRWRSFVAYHLRIRTSAQSVKIHNELRMKKLVMLDIWYDQALSYQRARLILQNVANRNLLTYWFTCWRQKTRRNYCNRLAIAWSEMRSKRNCFNALVDQTLGRKKSIRKWRKNYELLRVWRVWLLFVARKRSKHLADAHFRGFWMVRAVTKWHKLASQAISRRHKNQIASTWHSVMLQESVIASWKSAVSRTKRHELLTQRIWWKTIGTRSFRSWYLLLKQHEKLRDMDILYERKLLQRSWNALVQITKRRQVAQAMWKCTKGRILMRKCLHVWNFYTRLQHNCSARAEAMRLQNQKRQLSTCFHQWNKFMVIRAFVGLRKRRIATQRLRECWRSWILCWKLAQCQRARSFALLKRVLVGLRRYALQAQAYREVKSHCENRVLSSSLSRWRVEWWLSHSQRIMDQLTKQKVLSQWREFVQGRRQERQELRSAMNAKLSASRSAQAIGKTRRHATQAYKQASALQKRALYWRQVVSRIFHGWYLVMKTNQRRRLHLHPKRPYRRSAYQNAGLDQENVVPNNLHSSDQIGKHLHLCLPSKQRFDAQLPPQIVVQPPSGVALEFWSSQLLAKCFMAWKHQHRVNIGYSGT